MSAPIPVWLATVDDRGKVTLDRPWDFKCYARTLRASKVEVILRKRRVRRSDRANRYLFGVCYPIIAEHLGYTVKEVHEALAWHVLRLGNPDDPLPRRRSTADLNTAEFAEYTETVKRFASTEWGLYIPDPNEAEAA